MEQAETLGYETHAAFVLEENMAKTPANMHKLLGQLWPPALARAGREAAQMQRMIDEEGGRFKLQSWDWWYYSEQVSRRTSTWMRKCSVPISNWRTSVNGVFDVAKQLCGFSSSSVPTSPSTTRTSRCLRSRGRFAHWGSST